MRLLTIDHSADLLPLSHEAIYVTQSGDAIFFSFILYGVEQTLAVFLTDRLGGKEA